MIYCCVTNFLKIQQFTTINIYYAVSVVQESWSGLAVWFWLTVSQAADETSAKAVSSEGLAGAGESNSKTGHLILARVLTAWHLASPRESDPGGNKEEVTILL